MNKELINEVREAREELKRNLAAQISAAFEKDKDRITVDTTNYLVATPNYGKIYFPNAG